MNSYFILPLGDRDSQLRGPPFETCLFASGFMNEGPLASTDRSRPFLFLWPHESLVPIHPRITLSSEVSGNSYDGKKHDMTLLCSVSGSTSALLWTLPERPDPLH